MSLEHLYEGRFNRTHRLKLYRMGIYLLYQQEYLAENEEAARAMLDEEAEEICWMHPGMEISDRF